MALSLLSSLSAKSAAMTCPFLSRLPSQFVKNYSSKLLKTYGEHCPVVSQVRLLLDFSLRFNGLP